MRSRESIKKEKKSGRLPAKNNGKRENQKGIAKVREIRTRREEHKEDKSGGYREEKASE